MSKLLGLVQTQPLRKGDGSSITHVRLEIEVPLTALRLYQDIDQTRHLAVMGGVIDDAPLSEEAWALLERAGAAVPHDAHRMFSFYGPEEFCPARDGHGTYVRMREGEAFCWRCNKPARASHDNPEARLRAGRTPGGKGVYHVTYSGASICRGRNAQLIDLVYADQVPQDLRCKMPICRRAWGKL